MKLFIPIIIAVATFVSLFITPAESCDCDYHPGGCTISQAPAEGWKCKCVYKGAWTCGGVDIGCDVGETCPADCYSLECCKRANGDCGGY